MDNEEIMEILSNWNFWKKDIDVGIWREKYLSKMESYIVTKQVIAITGIRRSGKSTLMKQFIKKQIKSGKGATSFLYINFEEPLFADMLSLNSLNQIYKAYI